uniref:Uncharacterized protein n=1 Tax=Timema poppense TaxID=170557 RepID=A0A7R9CUS3_TIMPO|nr:unnamed protein product [Timema poppensis]
MSLIHSSEQRFETFVIAVECSSKEFSIVTFSSCGKYLAGCTIGGDICVWDIKQESCVMHEVIKNKNQICALAWNPSGSGELGYCDLTGQLGTIEGCIPVELNSNLDGNDLDDDDAQSKVSLKISELQPPFQPSATPQHLQHRFMMIGYGLDMIGYGLEMIGYGQEMIGYGREMIGYGREMIGYGRKMIGYGRKMIGYGRKMIGYGRKMIGYGREMIGYGREMVGYGWEMAGR